MVDDAIEREWRGRLTRWAKSGLRADEFAEREGVTVSTLYRWARRLELGPVKQGRGRPRNLRSVAPPGLLPVIVTPAVVTPEPAPAPVLEVLLRGGEVVRVPPGFDDDTLARIVRALGGVQ
ncbi:MAG: hypothetical protein IT382_03400 [Deltaproteobacteria bacterium]|nr:hypothetical protein [Deltaproteobacteria bacterium]